MILSYRAAWGKLFIPILNPFPQYCSNYHPIPTDLVPITTFSSQALSPFISPSQHSFCCPHTIHASKLYTN